MKNQAPQACFDNIVVQELPNELLICNTKTNQVFCLNDTAAEIWKLCDGGTQVEEIARKLTKRLKAPVGEELVLLALDELSKQNLLGGASPNRNFTGLTRREVVRRVGLGSMIALPLISSVVMPTAAQAQSGCPALNAPAGCPCATGATCSSGCCLENFPGSPICGPAFGQQGCICTSDAQCDTASFTCCAPSNPVCNPGC